MSDSRPPSHGPVISETRAKQGRRGIHVLIILLSSLALALLAAFFLGVFND